MPWRLAGAMILGAVAVTVGLGGQPAFAAPKPAPSAASTAGVAGHHAGRSGAGAKLNAKTPAAARAGGSGNAKAPASQRASAASSAAKAPAKASTAAGAAKAPAAAKASTAAKAPAKASTRAGTAKAAAGAVTEAISPNVVSGITVAPSATTAEVAWSAVTGATSYDVANQDGTSTCHLALPAASLKCTLTGLVADTQYTATVTANLASGTVSGTSGIFEVGKPDKPTGVTASMNTDGSITADWSAPANAHAGIDHYTATADDGAGGTATCDTTDETTTTCDVAAADLNPSTDYTVTVVAVGVADTLEPANDSDPSATSNTVTTPIGAPTISSAVIQPNGTTVRVTWVAPAVTTGIDHYTATTGPAGGSCSSAAATPAATTCDITTGLTPGVVYTVSVVANGTAAGVTSAPSAPSAPFVTGALNAPTGVMATAGDSEATVSWTAPTGFPAGAIDYYTVTSSDGQVCNTIDSSATSCTVMGLADLTSYTFTVVAHNSDPLHGDSAPSHASAPVIPLPSSVTLKAGANGKYVTAENAGNSALIANRAAAGAWEQFDVVGNSDGTISLRAGVNGKYVTAESGGAGSLIANRAAAGAWESFWLIDNGDGTFSLKAVANGKYVTAEGGGSKALIANRSSVGAWETFTITAS